MRRNIAEDLRIAFLHANFSGNFKSCARLAKKLRLVEKSAPSLQLTSELNNNTRIHRLITTAMICFTLQNGLIQMLEFVLIDIFQTMIS